MTTISIKKDVKAYFLDGIQVISFSFLLVLLGGFRIYLPFSPVPFIFQNTAIINLPQEMKKKITGSLFPQPVWIWNGVFIAIQILKILFI